MRSHQDLILFLAGATFEFVNRHVLSIGKILVLNPAFAGDELPASGFGFTGGHR
jgi:hypothetical protein